MMTTVRLWSVVVAKHLDGKCLLILLMEGVVLYYVETVSASGFFCCSGVETVRQRRGGRELRVRPTSYHQHGSGWMPPYDTRIPKRTGKEVIWDCL